MSTGSNHGSASGPYVYSSLNDDNPGIAASMSEDVIVTDALDLMSD